MDLYAEIVKMRSIADDHAWMKRRAELIYQVGERAFLAVSREVSADLHAQMLDREGN